MTEHLWWGALFVVGILSSTINVVAGGGSFLNLPLLIASGLSPGAANATNRVGVMAGLVSGTYKFARAGVLRWADLWHYCLPSACGGLLGAWLALQIDDRSFRVVLAGLMFFGSWTVIRRPARPEIEQGDASPRPWLGAVLFFLVGIYGGFIQAGTGFFALASTSALGIGIKRGNGIKVLSNIFVTVPALFLFLQNDLVDWPRGLALAAGMTLGGVLGVRVTQTSSPEALRKMVAAAIVVSAVFVLYPLIKGS